MIHNAMKDELFPLSVVWLWWDVFQSINVLDLTAAVDGVLCFCSEYNSVPIQRYLCVSINNFSWSKITVTQTYCTGVIWIYVSVCQWLILFCTFYELIKIFNRVLCKWMYLFYRGAIEVFSFGMKNGSYSRDWTDWRAQIAWVLDQSKTYFKAELTDIVGSRTI